MRDAGMVNVGQLARERHGEQDVAIVGFGSHHGGVITADSWGAPVQRMPLPPARSGSVEALLHDAVPDATALFVVPTATPDWLVRETPHRAVGVVYRPHAERWGNEVPTVLGRRYDAFCWFDESRALRPLHGPSRSVRRWRPIRMAADPARPVVVPAGAAHLDGDLAVPQAGRGVVLFAHGSGSSRHSPRNVQVADALQDAGFGTLLLDLLTPDEERVDARTRQHRFDIPLLAGRLTAAADWLAAEGATQQLPLATFGASTGAAAALITAAERPDRVGAVVSRGGRPDLAGDALARVRAPTLLLVGGDDREVLELNRAAAARLTAEHEVSVVPGATHLFEEPGTLDRVVELSIAWLCRWLTADG